MLWGVAHPVRGVAAHDSDSSSGPTEAEVAELTAGRLQMGEGYGYQVGEDFVGTPAQIIEQMQPFVELGVDYFMLDCGGFPQLTTVELLIQEVLPALNR